MFLVFSTLNWENTERNHNLRAHPPDPLHTGIRRNQQRTSWILCISPKVVTFPLSSYDAARSTYQTKSKRSKILRQWQPTSNPCRLPLHKKGLTISIRPWKPGCQATPHSFPPQPQHHCVAASLSYHPRILFDAYPITAKERLKSHQ